MTIDKFNNSIIEFLSSECYNSIVNKILPKEYFTEEEKNKILADSDMVFRSSKNKYVENMYRDINILGLVSNNKMYNYIIASVILEGYYTLYKKILKDTYRNRLLLLSGYNNNSSNSYIGLDLKFMRADFLHSFDNNSLTPKFRKDIIDRSESILLRSASYIAYENYLDNLKNYLFYILHNFSNLQIDNNQ